MLRAPILARGDRRLHGRGGNAPILANPLGRLRNEQRASCPETHVNHLSVLRDELERFVSRFGPTCEATESLRQSGFRARDRRGAIAEVLGPWAEGDPSDSVLS